MSDFDYKGLLSASREAIARAYHDADQQARQEEKNRKLAEIFNQATADYFGVASATAETIHENPNLGLLSPGAVEQLMFNGGVDVTADGIPLFRLIVRRANTDGLSPMAFGRAVQAALDKTCYGSCYDRLSVVGVKLLSGGSYVLLTLTWGCW